MCDVVRFNRGGFSPMLREHMLVCIRGSPCSMYSQSVEHETLNLRPVVGLRPTLGANIEFHMVHADQLGKR